MLHIQEIKNKNTWKSFLDTYNGFYPFFQTWNWGEVQKKGKIHIERIGIYDNEKMVGIAQISIITAKRGTYLHLRHGPVLKETKKEYIDFLIQYVAEIGKKFHATHIRLSPLIPEEIAREVFLKQTFRDAQIHRIDAETCWVLSLKDTEETILKNMRKSHRYLIKKALAMPIEIKKTKDPQHIKPFLDLYTTLALKKHFVAHSSIAEELTIFGKDNQAELFLAYFDNTLICGALIDFVGNMAIYRHSASDERYKHIPAMYVLQWKVIQEAKKRGMEYYNFWGIAPKEKPKHPWQGLTLFKTGFGGQEMNFSHAKDYVLSPRYWLIYALELYTKLKKGY